MYTKLYCMNYGGLCCSYSRRGDCSSSMRSDSPAFELSTAAQLGFLNLSSSKSKLQSFQILKAQVSSQFLPPIKASTNEGRFGYDKEATPNSSNANLGVNLDGGGWSQKSRNIVWHKCSVEKADREELLQQRGCVVWITGLSGSGKSTLACALSRALHSRGKLTYILDGDNIRHGLNRDLSFKVEDRLENIRRIGEVAKLFADAGVICIASVISPYRKERDACRALLPDRDFIEVFMDIPLQVCEARDPKGLYKLVRAGKIKGFTGIDDPYEPPLKPEITIHQSGQLCPSPCEMAEKVVSYLEMKGYLLA